MLRIRQQFAMTTGGSGPQPTLTIVNHPLPLSRREKAEADFLFSFLAVFWVLLAISDLMSVFIDNVLLAPKEKDMLLLSGMRPLAYWFSNLVCDYVFYVVVVIAIFIAFVVFGRAEFIGRSDPLGASILLFLACGFSIVCTAYWCSFFCRKNGKYELVVALGGVFVSCLLPAATWATITFSPAGSTERQVAVLLRFLFRLMPPFCLGDGLIHISAIDFVDRWNDHDAPRTAAFALDVAGWDIIFPLGLCPLALGIVAWMEQPSRRGRSADDGDDEAPPYDAAWVPEPIEGESDDVVSERRRLADSSPINNDGLPPPLPQGDIISVRNLRKVFPQKTATDEEPADATAAKKKKKHPAAICNLTFGVPQRGVFGLLGTNGAGKTTTLSILTGALLPTAGTCVVDGIALSPPDADPQAMVPGPLCQRFGYCAQSDVTSMADLSVEEHIDLFCALRGLDGALAERVRERLIADCALEDHRHKMALELSGGNQRRLCFALAIIGGPRVVFLDEPGASLDPLARRRLTGVIARLARQSAVVLTTHVLEDVERVADRVAILQEGGLLKCVGSLNDLRDRFGQGVELSVKVSDTAGEDEAPATTSGVLPPVETNGIAGEPMIVSDLASAVEALDSVLRQRIPFASTQHKSENRLVLTFPKASVVPSANPSPHQFSVGAVGPTDADNGADVEQQIQQQPLRYSQLFALLEELRDPLNLSNVSLSCKGRFAAEYVVTHTTLESIFLRATEDEEE